MLRSHANTHAPFVPIVRLHESIVHGLLSLHARGVGVLQPNSVLHIGSPSQKFQNDGLMQSATVVQL